MKDLSSKLEGLAEQVREHNRKHHDGGDMKDMMSRKGGGQSHKRTDAGAKPRTLRGESDSKGSNPGERKGESKRDFGQLPSGWKNTGEAPAGDEFGQKSFPVQGKPIAASNLSGFGGPGVGGGATAERHEESEGSEEEEGEEE